MLVKFTFFTKNILLSDAQDYKAVYTHLLHTNDLKRLTFKLKYVTTHNKIHLL